MCFHVEFMFECQDEPFSGLTAREIWQENVSVCVMLDQKCGIFGFKKLPKYILMNTYCVSPRRE